MYEKVDLHNCVLEKIVYHFAEKYFADRIFSTHTQFYDTFQDEKMFSTKTFSAKRLHTLESSVKSSLVDLKLIANVLPCLSVTT